MNNSHVFEQDRVMQSSSSSSSSPSSSSSHRQKLKQFIELILAPKIAPMKRQYKETKRIAQSMQVLLRSIEAKSIELGEVSRCIAGDFKDLAEQQEKLASLESNAEYFFIKELIRVVKLPSLNTGGGGKEDDHYKETTLAAHSKVENLTKKNTATPTPTNTSIMETERLAFDALISSEKNDMASSILPRFLNESLSAWSYAFWNFLSFLNRRP